MPRQRAILRRILVESVWHGRCLQLPHLIEIGRKVEPAQMAEPSGPAAARHVQHGADINYKVVSADYLIAGRFGAMLLDPAYAVVVSSEFDLR